jgi:hypothetical protein
MMIYSEEGRGSLLQRLAEFDERARSVSLLERIFDADWVGRAEEALNALELLTPVECQFPELLPFIDHCNDSQSLARLGRRLKRLSSIPGFSPRRYRRRFSSEAGDVLGVLFEINTLSRWASQTKHLEPRLPMRVTERRAEALLEVDGSRVYVECMALLFRELIAEFGQEAEARMARSVMRKIVKKGEQLEDADLPCVLTIALSPLHAAFLNAPSNPVMLGASLALRDPACAPISAVLIANGHHCEQVVGPFPNSSACRQTSTDVVIALRRPWIPEPDCYPINEWSPLESIPD